MDKIKYIIFDMDETLLDTTRAWKKAETELFRFLGSDYDPAVARQYKGMNAYDVGRTINRALATTRISEDDCGRKMREFLIQNYHEPVEPMPGAQEFLNLAELHFTLAVASGSPLEGIKAALATQNWQPYFTVLVSSEEVAKGKPEPHVFLETAQRLKADPSECLVIEDNLNGAIAAKQAGMCCFTVPSIKDIRISEWADQMFGSLREITLENIRQL